MLLNFKYFKIFEQNNVSFDVVETCTFINSNFGKTEFKLPSVKDLDGLPSVKDLDGSVIITERNGLVRWYRQWKEKYGLNNLFNIDIIGNKVVITAVKCKENEQYFNDVAEYENRKESYL